MRPQDSCPGTQRRSRPATDPVPCPYLLDNPAAAARSLRAHMEPADLMELTLILAEAAADVRNGFPQYKRYRDEKQL